MSNYDDMKAVLEGDGWAANPNKSTDKELHGECPKCGTNTPTNPDRFRVNTATGEWNCRSCEEGGTYPIGYLKWRYGDSSWAEHAKRLGVKVEGGSDNGTSSDVSKSDLSKAPEEGATTVTPPDLSDVPAPTKTTWNDLEDFCQNKVGIPAWFAKDTLRWTQTETSTGQTAVKMEMDDGSFRIRPFNTKTFYQIPAPGVVLKKGQKNPATWYMFPPDVKKLIILCNGQTSVAAAQFHNIDAFCFTDGEKAIPNYLLKQLTQRFAANNDTVCIIALDGDKAGRKATKAIEKQLSGYPIRIVDFGGKDGYDLGDYCKRNGSQSLERLVKLSHPPQSAQVVSSHEASERMFTKLTGSERFPASNEYVPVPWRSFHKFGGMMKVLPPGLVAVAGTISGGGKTSLAETWVDLWLKMGFDVLWRGDEWDANGYDVRRKQRYGGMTYEQFMDDQVWQDEEKRNVPNNLRYGVPLPAGVKEKSLQIGQAVKRWPGKVWYFPYRPTIEQTQLEMESLLHQLRREGRRPAIVVWDYISLLRSDSDNDANQAEAVMHSIKTFASKTGLATLALSQILKSTEEKIKSGENVHLSSSDLYYVRPDKANLILGLVPLYTKQADKQGVLSVQPDKFNRVRVEILKNSLGQPYGNVYIQSNLSHLAFSESKINP